VAQPSSRDEFTDYCLRRLGAPVLEINVDVDQVDDLIDDAIQFFQEKIQNSLQTFKVLTDLSVTMKSEILLKFMVIEFMVQLY